MRLGFVLTLLVMVGCATDADGDGSPEGTDCDDANASVAPTIAERCDGIDNDCDGEVDEGVTDTYYLDSDGDGYGIEAVTTEDCDVPAGYAAVLGDCDDFDAAANPDVDEECDGIDNDCDDKVDENVTIVFYYDGDSDGVGAGGGVEACEDAPPTDPDGVGHYVTEDGDCDDTDPAISPYATEICDGIDNDCQGDEDGDDDKAVDALTWYVDDDGDGYGVDFAATNAVSCTQPGGYVDNTDDCDDSDADNNPLAEEVCGDGEDNDCDAEVDEEDATDALTWYGDADGDGFGGRTFSQVSCAQPTSYVTNDDDCNDLNADINPDAQEICDEVDNDCDSLTDDGDVSISYVDADGNAVIWYIDVDGDGYGSDRFTLQKCDQPTNYVASDLGSLDCNDKDETVNPGEEEVCDDGKDNNCDDSPSPCSLEGDQDIDDADFWIRGNEGKTTSDRGDQVGWSLAIGDFNNDGRDDMIVGAIGLDGDNSDDGGAYIFYGPLDDDRMGASSGADVVFVGDEDADNAGYAVSAVDLDGDGYDDVMISSYGRDLSTIDDAGVVYVLYGSATKFSGTVSLESEYDALFQGGQDEEHFGCVMDNAGDVNGDDRDDVLVGACMDNAPGTAYLIYGSRTRFSGDYTPYDEITDEENGYASWVGATDNSYTGQAVTTIGDFDGDGYSDFVFGGYGHDVKISSTSTYADAGAAFLVYGDATEHIGEIDVTNAGAYIYGENAYDNAGFAVSGAGDVNGDGYSDFIVGAPGYSRDLSSDSSGAAYLILGSGTQILGKLTATASILGENQYDLLGGGLGYVGDLNDDDYADLAVGAPDEGGNYGAVYLYYGPVSGDVDASDADAKFAGNDSGVGEFGRNIAGPGDMDNDGELDLIIGAGSDDADGESDTTDVGAIYIVTGGGL